MPTPLARRYAEPADVRRRDDAPIEFVWRGRLYRVRAVLATWLEAGGWWRLADPGGGSGEGVGTDGGPILIDDGEREVWRVEAAAGRSAATGIYDVCFAWSTGAWTVTRIQD